MTDAYYCKECVKTGKDRDGCPKIVNLGSTKTDLFYERKKVCLLALSICLLVMWYCVICLSFKVLQYSCFFFISVWVQKEIALCLLFSDSQGMG